MTGVEQIREEQKMEKSMSLNSEVTYVKNSSWPIHVTISYSQGSSRWKVEFNITEKKANVLASCAEQFNITRLVEFESEQRWCCNVYWMASDQLRISSLNRDNGVIVDINLNAKQAKYLSIQLIDRLRTLSKTMQSAASSISKLGTASKGLEKVLPKCLDCHGTGRVPMFNRDIDCDCVKNTVTKK